MLLARGHNSRFAILKADFCLTGLILAALFDTSHFQACRGIGRILALEATVAVFVARRNLHQFGDIVDKT